MGYDCRAKLEEMMAGDSVEPLAEKCACKRCNLAAVYEGCCAHCHANVDGQCEF